VKVTRYLEQLLYRIREGEIDVELVRKSVRRNMEGTEIDKRVILSIKEKGGGSDSGFN